MDKPMVGGSAVVARFADGRVLKGMTNDFAPQKSVFHLYVRENAVSRGVAVTVASLKALFFVKTYDGDSKHVENLDVSSAKGPGRKIVVTFADGEVVAGFTTGYSRDKQGFFVVPADPSSNNARVYVVTASVKGVAWADDAATRKLGA